MMNPVPHSIFYLGRSMHPLFQEGDEILFQPSGNRPILPGDVVVFSRPGEDRYIIHRIIEARPNGFRTQGDRNTQPDPWVLDGGDILGRVVGFRRAGKYSPVRGGISGAWQSAALRRWLPIRTRLVHALDPFLLSGFYSGALAAWVPERYRPRVLSIKKDAGAEFLLMMGKRVVGRRFAGAPWQIRRRYRPFIESRKLEVRSKK